MNTNPSYICLGVDPGSSSGAIAVIRNGHLQLHGIGSLTERQIERIFYETFLDKGLNAELFAVIERVHSRKGQGISSTFKFGMNYGFLRGCLVANRIPFESVLPKTWQKHYSMAKKKTETDPQWKRRLLGIAQNLYPGADIPLYAADAVLLAYYARHKLTSNE
jgi:crossover junction endodeoxyribonuclease RuvC